MEDRLIIDVTSAARPLGLAGPIAVTAVVWDGLVVPPPAISQTQEERLRMLLKAYRVALHRALNFQVSKQFHFTCYFALEAGVAQVTLTAVKAPKWGVIVKIPDEVNHVQEHGKQAQ